MNIKSNKLGRIAWTFVITSILFLALFEFWVYLEVKIQGQMDNSLVDNLISIPILVSLWFNAKMIISKILKE